MPALVHHGLADICRLQCYDVGTNVVKLVSALPELNNRRASALTEHNVNAKVNFLACLAHPGRVQ